MSTAAIHPPSDTPCNKQVPDAPMTPPLSPGQSEHGYDLPAEDIRTNPLIVPPIHTIQAEARSSSFVAPPAAEFDGFGAMEVDQQQPPASQELPPASRSLDDERTQIQSSGLRLTDFEVRGTLGELFPFSSCQKTMKPLSQGPAPLAKSSLCESGIQSIRLGPKTTLR